MDMSNTCQTTSLHTLEFLNVLKCDTNVKDGDILGYSTGEYKWNN